MMQEKPTRMSGRKKEKKSPIPKGKFRHISIRHHDNGGVTVDSEHEPSGPKKGKGPMNGGMGMGMIGPAMDSHSAAFDNPTDAAAHVQQLMGTGGPAAPETPPAPEGDNPAPGATGTEPEDGE